jgi:hypothetical protein
MLAVLNTLAQFRRGGSDDSASEFDLQRFKIVYVVRIFPLFYITIHFFSWTPLLTFLTKPSNYVTFHSPFFSLGTNEGSSSRSC